jgi:hypothetical protein
VSGAMYMEKIVISLLGELLALMSVFFRCRLYFISSRLQPGDPSLGMTIKREYPFLRVKCNPGIHPPLFENPNQNLATEFKDFLDRVRRLNPGYIRISFAGQKNSCTTRTSGCRSSLGGRLRPRLRPTSLGQRSTGNFNSWMPEDARNGSLIFRYSTNSKRFCCVIYTLLRSLERSRVVRAIAKPHSPAESRLHSCNGRQWSECR